MADQLVDLHPQENDNLRLILIESYSESAGRPDGRWHGRFTPQYAKHHGKIFFLADQVAF